jgi:Ran GTPase-activating protein (RanGAP) involved in mRNA processing and transport
MKMQTELISKHGKKTEMIQVWKFLCGITRTYYTEANFNHLINQTQCGIVFDMQCSFETQQPFTCKSVVAKHGVYREYQSCEHVSNHSTQMVRILMSQQQAAVNTLHFTNIFLTPSDFTAMTFLVSNTPICNIELENCTFGEDGLATLLKKLHPYTKILALYCNNISSSLTNIHIPSNGACAVARSLEYLTELDIHLNSICSGYACALFKRLTHCNNLTKLNIHSNNIEFSGACALAKSLQNCRALSVLDISLNAITDAGAVVLVDALRHCTDLKHLDLSYNYICFKGAISTAEAMKYWVELRELKLDGNYIGDKGARAILLSAKNHCSKLMKLNISFGNFSSSSILELTEKLQLHESDT